MAGTLSMFTQANFGGETATITEGGIPSECTQVPFGISTGALSTINGTTGTTVAYYTSAANCASDTRLATLGPLSQNSDFGTPATHFRSVAA